MNAPDFLLSYSFCQHVVITPDASQSLRHCLNSRVFLNNYVSFPFLDHTLSMAGVKTLKGREDGAAAAIAAAAPAVAAPVDAVEYFRSVTVVCESVSED